LAAAPSYAASTQDILQTAYSKKGQNYYKVGMCTGYVCSVYRKNKIKMPKNETVGHMKNRLRRYRVRKRKKGDIVAFGSSHVGIYIGNGKVIHASWSRKKVSITKVKYICGNKTYYRLI
jgi:cell wall-associated NlpC family hydrolase